MSRHNYTNPAFCQQSEFYPSPSTTNGNCGGGSSDTPSPAKVHRSESIHSFKHIRASDSVRPVRRNSVRNASTPPRPGPKPQCNLNVRYGDNGRTASTQRLHQATTEPPPVRTPEKIPTEGYALVPVSELPSQSKGRYAYVPAHDTHLVRGGSRVFAKSQDHIDRTTTSQLSLLPSPGTRDEPSSLILVDQKSLQRYAMIPTEDDEELVDDNQEIIQMHNGRAHRYAVIPTDDDDDEETCLSSEFELSAISHSYATIADNQQHQVAVKTPQKIFSASSHHTRNAHTPPSKKQPSSMTTTPTKNPLLATQKLHELLSTPRKTPALIQSSQQQRENSTIRNSSRRYQSQIISSTPIRHQLLYDQSPLKVQNIIDHSRMVNNSQYEQRTTAVISPRLASLAAYSESSSNRNNKSWNSLSFQKVTNATDTIGAISLMLIICGAMNSGLCLYMIANFGRIYYLDIGNISGFASVALGILGFRSRQCDWLPNRNYISGYILVTVFSLLNCCGLLVLIGLRPIPGTPIHDVTTGVVLGLSSLTLLIISLGVITSRWCRAPPPDNRVDVY